MIIKLINPQRPFKYTFNDLLRRLNQRIDEHEDGNEFYSLSQGNAYWVGRPDVKGIFEIIRESKKPSKNLNSKLFDSFKSALSTNDGIDTRIEKFKSKNSELAVFYSLFRDELFIEGNQKDGEDLNRKPKLSASVSEKKGLPPGEPPTDVGNIDGPGGGGLQFSKLVPIRNLFANLRADARFEGWDQWGMDYILYPNGVAHPNRIEQNLSDGNGEVRLNLNPKTPLVYLIVSPLGPMFYVGITRNSFEQRLKTHLAKIWALRCNACSNHTGPIGQPRVGWKSYAVSRFSYLNNQEVADTADKVYVSCAEIHKGNPKDYEGAVFSFFKGLMEALKNQRAQAFGEGDYFVANTKIPTFILPGLIINPPANWD